MWFYAFLVLFRFISFEEPSLLVAKSGTGFLKIRRLLGSTRSHRKLTVLCWNSVWTRSQQYLSLLRVLTRCLKAVLKRFLMIPNLLETLLFKRLLLTFSPLINERLTWVEVRSSFDRFRFILVAWTAAVASCKMVILSEVLLHFLVTSHSHIVAMTASLWSLWGFRWEKKRQHFFFL